MNRRLKELAADAGYPDYMTYGQDKVLERFAELIVRECVQVCEDDITDGDACCTNTADRIARRIKTHFGVEE